MEYIKLSSTFKSNQKKLLFYIQSQLFLNNFIEIVGNPTRFFKKPAYNMKGFRNKIYNPSFNNERLMKYNQVKNIIIEKNQEIRMLTAENDYLKQTIDKKILNQRYYSPKSEFSLKTNISN